MKKINISDVPDQIVASPKGRYGCAKKGLSIALGRVAESTDQRLRHPFDVEVRRIPAGRMACPYHAHSAQWEFYYVLAGRGRVRDASGWTPVEAGDAFHFEPGQAHQLAAAEAEDLMVMIVADNPVGESCYYPDSGKWLVCSPERRVIRSESVDYFDGEE